MTEEKKHSHTNEKIIPFRSTIRRLMKDLGMPEVDEKTIEMIEKSALMLNDMKGEAQSIAVRAGCVLLFIHITNYNEIQRKLIKGLHNGYITQERPMININIEMGRNLICINLDEKGDCRILDDYCEFKENGHWWACEIVDNSLLEEIKHLGF